MFRALFELGLLAAAAWSIWHLTEGGTVGLLLTGVAVIALLVVWAVPGVPGDPVRGKPIVRVPGATRLVIECAAIFLVAFATWVAGSRAASETLLTAAVIQFALTWNRCTWLVHRRQSTH